LNSQLTDRAASPPAWPCETRCQACSSGEYAIAAEMLMSNAGSVFSWSVYHFLHSEPVDFDQDPLVLGPMQPGRKPFDANQAISTILFERSSRRFHELYPGLKKLRHHRLAFFAYPLSGGFEHPSLMPTWMVHPVLAFERLLGVLSRYLAFRILVVLEKGSP
jgi:hypothetical protein